MGQVKSKPARPNPFHPLPFSPHSFPSPQFSPDIGWNMFTNWQKPRGVFRLYKPIGFCFFCLYLIFLYLYVPRQFFCELLVLFREWNQKIKKLWSKLKFILIKTNINKKVRYCDVFFERLWLTNLSQSAKETLLLKYFFVI